MKRLFSTPHVHWPSVGKTLVALALVAATGAAAVVGFGLYNVSARLGHLPGVEWILHTTFRNSVQLWSGGSEPPQELRTPEMVALGAGHYDSACAPCHARPGEQRSATVRAMEPEPPPITEAVKDWEPDELHWLVHEGAKMTGMPGWPAARSDDVWPVVAFLLDVGEMTADEYGALTAKPGGSYCAMCHGETGVSENPNIPRLDILSETYMARSLAAYRSGARGSGIMQHAASVVPESALSELAGTFAETAPAGGPGTMSEAAERGRELAFAAGPAADVPACRACHGPWGEPLNPAFPSLAGQYEPYLAQQLHLWRDAARGGTEAAELMHHAARALSDDDIDNLAAYYSSLAPAELDDVGQ